jgi:hypothetical protein
MPTEGPIEHRASKRAPSALAHLRPSISTQRRREPGRSPGQLRRGSGTKCHGSGDRCTTNAPQQPQDLVTAELSAWTFWSFVGEFSLLRRHGAAAESGAGSGHTAAAFTQVTGCTACSGRSLRTHRSAAFQSSAVGDHAAAWMDGHLRHAVDRLASMRARRAAAARAVRSAGTASPRPKYISSGVWPRNAEWGSTVLCSWT